MRPWPASHGRQGMTSRRWCSGAKQSSLRCSDGGNDAWYMAVSVNLMCVVDPEPFLLLTNPGVAQTKIDLSNKYLLL